MLRNITLHLHLRYLVQARVRGGVDGILDQPSHLAQAVEGCCAVHLNGYRTPSFNDFPTVSDHTSRQPRVGYVEEVPGVHCADGRGTHAHLV